MFSQLVDEVAVLGGRQNRIADISRYCNSTVRECNVRQSWAKDLVEDTVSVAALPFTINRPITLRHFRTVNYNADIWPAFIEPGRKQNEFDNYYYASTTYYVFVGVSIGDTVNYAYYTNSPHLLYHTGATGDEYPALYDEATATWTYWDSATSAYVSTLGTTALDDAARALVTNWLITDWKDLIIEGTLAKLYKSTSNPSAPLSFALYKSMQTDLEKGEQFASAGA